VEEGELGELVRSGRLSAESYLHNGDPEADWKPLQTALPHLLSASEDKTSVNSETPPVSEVSSRTEPESAEVKPDVNLENVAAKVSCASCGTLWIRSLMTEFAGNWFCKPCIGKGLHLVSHKTKKAAPLDVLWKGGAALGFLSILVFAGWAFWPSIGQLMDKTPPPDWVRSGYQLWPSLVQRVVVAQSEEHFEAGSYGCLVQDEDGKTFALTVDGGNPQATRRLIGPGLSMLALENPLQEPTATPELLAWKLEDRITPQFQAQFSLSNQRPRPRDSFIFLMGLSEDRITCGRLDIIDSAGTGRWNVRVDDPLSQFDLRGAPVVSSKGRLIGVVINKPEGEEGVSGIQLVDAKSIKRLLSKGK